MADTVIVGQPFQRISMALLFNRVFLSFYLFAILFSNIIDRNTETIFSHNSVITLNDNKFESKLTEKERQRAHTKANYLLLFLSNDFFFTEALN